MRKAEILALVRAHRGRARPVAFFHVLRQPALEPDDHAFLSEHIEELGATIVCLQNASGADPHAALAVYEEKVLPALRG